jgi:ABC-type nitrate/sulfonate/bicarbonate transport system permease component
VVKRKEGLIVADTQTQTSAIAVTDLRAQVRNAALKSLARSVGRSALVGVLTLVIVLVAWIAVVTFSGVSTFITKNPLDVWQFLVTDEDASENLATLVDNLSVTLGHASIGFVAGLIGAIVGAIIFRLSRSAETALMPFAMLLRSVPLIALAPVIILIFGYKTDVTTGVIGGIVVLFPALVTIAVGLKSASPQMLDVVSVYGGNIFTAVRKVALPGALPSLFAAIRVSVPGAITGALLAEMLSTGDGLGRKTVEYATQAKFADLWASVVAITAISLLLYIVVQILESIVLSRMGMATERRGR